MYKRQVVSFEALLLVAEEASIHPALLIAGNPLRNVEDGLVLLVRNNYRKPRHAERSAQPVEHRVQGDVYKRQPLKQAHPEVRFNDSSPITPGRAPHLKGGFAVSRFGWGARSGVIGGESLKRTSG